MAPVVQKRLQQDGVPRCLQAASFFDAAVAGRQQSP